MGMRYESLCTCCHTDLLKNMTTFCSVLASAYPQIVNSVVLYLAKLEALHCKLFHFPLYSHICFNSMAVYFGVP